MLPGVAIAISPVVLVLAGVFVFTVLGYSSHSAARGGSLGELPDPQLLMSSLAGEIPDGFKIEIDTTVGRRIDAGTVGD